MAEFDRLVRLKSPNEIAEVLDRRVHRPIAGSPA